MNNYDASLRPTRRSILWPHLALLGLILLAFSLRLYRLPAQSLWYDEGVSWYMTQLSPPALTLWTADDIQPPLYYYLLWLWVRLAGTSEYALRFPSLFFGALTIPLLWTTARQLFGKGAGWLAALMLALSPLHIYYAQEARMYTLLTCLGLLSSYLLLRLLSDQSTGLRSPYTWAYILVSVAALYTHYFAFFLLAAQALYVIFQWRQQARPGQLLKTKLPIPISIPTAIAILYLPWLPFLVTRYGVDTSYWAGELKLGEVARKLLIAFSLGETVREKVGIWLALGYGIILLISLAILWQKTRHPLGTSQYSPYASYSVVRRDVLVFLLSYLIIPVALVLLLVYRTPKFNPRYAMLASPAFLLLFAGGLSSLIPHHAPRTTHYVPHIIFAIALIYILSTSAYSLYNWYQPYRLNQFNKADFRITAQIVRERIGPDEIVLLNSGHMFPAWAYYYGWEGWERLPDIEVLDVNAALDLSVGDELDRLLDEKRGTWLVRWQNEVTDPFDVLPLYLGTVGTQDDYGQFWHMELFHYSLPPEARFDLVSFITQPAYVDFGDQAQLLGMRRTSDTELVLFWEALSSMQTDYTIFVHLRNADGKTLADADHLPPRPTREWQPGQTVPDRVTLRLPSDSPAGEYHVEVGLYDAGQPGLPRLPLADGSGDRAILPWHELSVEAGDLE